MRSKLSYANVTATLALFVALGGSSYAAVQLTGKNIRDASLTTKDVKDRSLLGRDFKAGQLPAGSPGAPGTNGEQGVQGIQGLQGQKGDDGDDGAPGSALAYAEVTASGSLSGTPKNIDRATKINFGSPVTGYYCLHATVPVNNIVATLRGTDLPGGEIKMSLVSNINCANNGTYNVQVSTFNSAGAFEDRPFYIAIN
jgi:Collagen triple helix repeat (20 copies)